MQFYLDEVPKVIKVIEAESKIWLPSVRDGRNGLISREILFGVMKNSENGGCNCIIWTYLILSNCTFKNNYNSKSYGISILPQ